MQKKFSPFCEKFCFKYFFVLISYRKIQVVTSLEHPKILQLSSEFFPRMFSRLKGTVEKSVWITQRLRVVILSLHFLIPHLKWPSVDYLGAFSSIMLVTFIKISIFFEEFPHFPSLKFLASQHQTRKTFISLMFLCALHCVISIIRSFLIGSERENGDRR